MLTELQSIVQELHAIFLGRTDERDFDERVEIEFVERDGLE